MVNNNTVIKLALHAPNSNLHHGSSPPF